MDEATVEILLRARQEGLDAIKDMKDALEDLRQQARQTNEWLSFMAPVMLATSLATAAASEAMDKLRGAQSAHTAAASSAIPVLTGLQGALAGLAPAIGGLLVGMPLIVAGVAALVVALYPLVLTLAGAITLVSAFAVGVGAVATSLGLAGFALFGMAGAVVMLADRLFTTGKIMSDPLLGLENNLSKMADAWGMKALPMAKQMIDWLDSLIPRIQQAGFQLLDWFGARMPAVLQVAAGAFNSLMVAFDALGKVLGPFIDRMLAQMPQWQGIFQQLLLIGVQAIAGLLDNLGRLSAWFIERMPALGPIVGQIMGAIGQAIQWLGARAGELVDWFILHWPAIVLQAQQVWNQLAPILGQMLQGFGNLLDWLFRNWPSLALEIQRAWIQIQLGWAQMAPLLMQLMPLAFQIAATMMQFMAQNSQLVRDALVALGAAAVLTIAVLATVGVVILGVVAVIMALYQAFVTFTDYINRAVLPAVIAFVQATQGAIAIVWAFISAVGSLLGPLGQLLQVTGIWISTMVQAVGGIQQIISKLQELITIVLQTLFPIYSLGTALISAFTNALGPLGRLIGGIFQIQGAAGAASASLSALNAQALQTISDARYAAAAASFATPSPSATISGGPSFQAGGIVPGPIGAPTLAIVHGGERVIPLGGTAGGSVAPAQGGSRYYITFNIQGGDPIQTAAAIDVRLSQLLNTT